MSIELDENKKHMIIKRDGRIEPYNENKLRKVINWATENNSELSSILFDNFNIKIGDEMHIQTLYDELINTAANLITEEDGEKWDEVAKKLYLMKIYKETYNLKKIGAYPHLSQIFLKGTEKNVYNESIIKTFSIDEINELNNAIEPNRDLIFNYKGLRIFFDKYCKFSKKKNKKFRKKLELPQITYMTSAIHSFYNMPHETYQEKKLRLKKIIECYELMSKHYITYSTPRMSFGVSKYSQFASCVLIAVGDNIESIMQSAEWAGIFSKWAGGISIDITNIRSSGSVINSNDGKSLGPIPFIKIYESTISAFNQGGKRPGAGIIYFPWWHYDVLDLLMLKDEGGVEDQRARKLKYGININDVFLKRVEEDGNITLFDPNEVGDLKTSYGTKFEEIYENLEKNADIRGKVIKAKDLMYEIIKTRAETGNLYINFIDNVNSQNMTNRYVSMSNLCVGEGTTILVQNKGEQKIEDYENQEPTCWNGYQWSRTRIEKTSDDAELWKVTLFNEKTGQRKYLNVTREHIWYIQFSEDLRGINYSEIIEKEGIESVIPASSGYEEVFRTNTGFIYDNNLMDGILYIAPYKLPFKPNSRVDEETMFINRSYSIESIDLYGRGATYCGNEPINHTLTFNGIMTGQCAEITVPARPSKKVSESYIINEKGETEVHRVNKDGEIGLCNLSSINCMKWFYELDDNKKDSLVRNMLEGMDNIIESQFYPVKEAAISNKKYRPIGIGITDFANLVAHEKIKYTDEKIFQFTNDLMDDIYYRIYKTSMELAKERGAFEGFRKSLWAKGETPFSVSIFRKNNPLRLDFDYEKWFKLGEEIAKSGVRFSLHGSIPPSATSGKVTNATESCEPVKGLYYIEAGTHNLPTIVKGKGKFDEYYTTCWNVPNWIINYLAAIRQVYLDQSQSFNHYNISIKSAKNIYKDIYNAWELGIKSLYYLQTPKAGMEVEITCEGACSV